MKSDPRRYNAFVSNRLREIDKLTNISEWRWIPSKLNVADDATRLKTEFIADNRWQKGQEILFFKSENEWPVLNEESTNVNKKSEVLVTLLVSEEPYVDVLPEVTFSKKYSKNSSIYSVNEDA